MVEGDGSNAGGFMRVGSGVVGACCDGVCRMFVCLSCATRVTCRGRDADLGSGGGVVLRGALFSVRCRERSETRGFGGESRQVGGRCVTDRGHEQQSIHMPGSQDDWKR